MRMTIDVPGSIQQPMTEAIRHRLRAYILPVHFAGAIVNDGTKFMEVNGAYLDAVAENCASDLALEVLQTIAKARVA